MMHKEWNKKYSMSPISPNAAVLIQSLAAAANPQHTCFLSEVVMHPDHSRCIKMNSPVCACGCLCLHADDEDFMVRIMHSSPGVRISCERIMEREKKPIACRVSISSKMILVCWQLRISLSHRDSNSVTHAKKANEKQVSGCYQTDLEQEVASTMFPP
jgi:hypothetical protein